MKDIGYVDEVLYTKVGEEYRVKAFTYSDGEYKEYIVGKWYFRVERGIPLGQSNRNKDDYDSSFLLD